MKFIASQKKLFSALSKLKSVVPTRPIIPVLENVLIQAYNGQIKLSVTDLEVRFATEIAAEISVEGAITIPYKKFVETIAALPEQPVVIEIFTETNTAQITADSGKYKLCGESAENYPKEVTLTTPTFFSLPSEVLQDSFNVVLPFAGNDELRPAMTAVCIDISETQIKFIATNTSILGLVTKDFVVGKTGRYLVPAKSAAALKNSLPQGDIHIYADANNISFLSEGYNFTTRLKDERYPDYNAAIPKDANNIASLNKTDLQGCISRVKIYANNLTHQGRFRFNGNLKVTAADVDFSNEAQETLACTHEGVDLEIGLNLSLLNTALSVLDSEDISLKMTEYNRPVILQKGDSQDTLILIMPIVLNA